jgi:hypothetical protein
MSFVAGNIMLVARVKIGATVDLNWAGHFRLRIKVAFLKINRSQSAQ